MGFKAAAKACTENELCKQLMECKKKHKESGGKGDGKGKGDHEEVCVEEMKACAADKECSLLHAKLLHYKLQEAKKDGKDGGKDGYGKGEGKGDHGGKDGYGKDGDKKGDYEGKKGDYDAKKKDEDHGRRRQLDQHGDKKPPMKKDGEGKKDDCKKDDGKKDGDYKKDDGKDKKDMEPSAEFKAAAKACTENKLCKQLMECMKKHADSGGKGDGKGKGDHEEVCVEEMKACAADKEC